MSICKYFRSFLLKNRSEPNLVETFIPKHPLSFLLIMNTEASTFQAHGFDSCTHLPIFLGTEFNFLHNCPQKYISSLVLVAILITFHIDRNFALLLIFVVYYFDHLVHFGI